MEITASSLTLRANAPEGRKAISYQTEPVSWSYHTTSQSAGLREIFAAKFFGDRQFRDALHGLQPAAAKLRQR